MNLPLPLGYIDAVTIPLVGDRLLIRFSDVMLDQLVEAEVTLEQAAEWQRIGGLPANLTLHRRYFDEAIDDAIAERADIEARRERMRDRWHGIAEGEWD